LHIDNTARLKIIIDKTSLLYKVARSTEIKMLLNTSFNIASDPIIFDYIDVFIICAEWNFNIFYFIRDYFASIWGKN